ncbi:MAG: DNA polymerase/3'-5' exonuclease PolX [Phycisphaerales bacterium]|jgi:DNA polymerase (family 10)|nr:DNA polymerase/3'-5' exonuclease PolX [Phycisphaerales bacterium]
MGANEKIASLLEQMAEMLELLGEDKFRVNAHARAARAIESLGPDVTTMSRGDVLALDGIGAKMADKIEEFAKRGAIAEHEELAARVPAGLLEVLRVPGLGPKTVKLMWEEKGVESIADLKRIIDDGTILELPRMGAKTVENIKKSLAFAEGSGQRLPLGLAMPIAEAVVAHMEKVKGVERVAFAGSLRRGRETIGDIDILVCAKDPKKAHEAFTSMPGVREVLASGETKSSVRMDLSTDGGRWGALGAGGVQVDLRTLPIASWGAALMYFTGSKEHNVRLRERALKKGLTLNEYGLFPEDDDKTPPQHRGVKPVASKTEEEVYAALGQAFVPPEAREDRGEFDREGWDDLVTIDDIRAELHAHTTASDGLMSIEELARRAKERGFHTIVVTDHSRASAQANGLSIDRLMEQIEDVARARSVVKGIQILTGSEVDILADGTLDYPDDVLRKLDVVVASPHVSTNQEPDVATKRLLSAVSHPMVHVLGHPTARLINRRPGLSPDMGAIIAAAKENSVALEVNAHWMRLDLRDAHVRMAVDAGCLVAIDCDDHAPEDFDNLRYGVMTARRGWLTKALCVNTWTQKKLTEWLRSKR